MSFSGIINKNNYYLDYLNRRRTLKLTLLIFVYSILFASTFKAFGALEFEGMTLEPGVSIKGISVPIYDPSSQQIALTMYVGEISVEPAKVGFMKINVFPRIVFRDCILILVQSNDSWCRALAAHLKENAVTSNALIHSIKLTRESRWGELYLEANSARFYPQMGKIDLEGVTWLEGESKRHAPKAAISLEGKDRGSVIPEFSGFFKEATHQ